jgi:tetratricopeptide (TPR) repeat protein
MPPTEPAIKPALSPHWGVLLGGGLIVLAGLVAYSNSFSAPFIFDDFPAIMDNPTIRHLGSAWSPPHDVSGVTSRPVVNFSLAVNYALSGNAVWSYHATNLAIHILAALTLFGIVRRTLLRISECGRDAPWPSKLKRNRLTPPTTLAEAALPLAFTVALLWAVHPLQTESVTCIIQRTESLMGLFYLLTLYCFIRAVEGRSGFTPDPSGINPDLQPKRGNPPNSQLPALNFQPSTFNSRIWSLGSIFFCLLGMATKEVMVTAPLMVLLYDRTFVAGTFREAWKKRRQFYAALACTWILLGYLVITAGGKRGTAAGFGLGITPWTYALTQCRAIIHYLKLSVWPHPLVLDYGTKVVPHLAEVLPQAVAVVLLVLATIFCVWRRPALGFVGAWFFAILAPSSSVVPLIAQTVAEHRMYLPLAAVVVWVVLGLYRLIGRPAVYAGAGLAVLLTVLTLRRNEVYQNNIGLWRNTVAKCPDNARALYNLGYYWAKTPNRLSDAIAAYEAALRINSNYVDAHNALGNALFNLPGRLPDAMAQYKSALRIDPNSAEAHNNLGNALLKMPGRLPDAIAQYESALRIDSNSAEAHNNLGTALLKMPGLLPNAVGQYEAALRIDPDFAQAHFNLGAALLKEPDRLPDAMAQFQAALRINPDYVDAHNALGNALFSLPGRLPDAMAQYEAALRINPGSAEAHYNLGNALLNLPGRLPDAMAEYEAALRIKPDYAEAHNNLGNALLNLPGRLPDAIAEYKTALRLKPDYPEAHYNLGNAFFQSGRFTDALGEYRTAIQLNPDYAEAHNNLGNALAELGRLSEAVGQYEQALRINPDYVNARKDLEQVRNALEQPAR